MINNKGTAISDPKTTLNLTVEISHGVVTAISTAETSHPTRNAMEEGDGILTLRFRVTREIDNQHFEIAGEGCSEGCSGLMWPFTGKEVRGGDLSGEPGHGPGWAPKATEEDLRAWREQGSVCMCSACKRYRRGE